MTARKHPEQKPDESLENEDISVVEDEEMKPHKGFGKTDTKLKDELHAANIEKQKYLEGWQRAQADLINYKRTTEDERKGIADRAIGSLLEELLPVLDAFDMAFGNKEAWEAAPKNWRDGVVYIHQQLIRTLEDRNMTVIDPLGLPFNPHEHEAIAHVPTDDSSKDHTVVTVRQKGYRIKDRVIRPARVEVADFKQE